jgi:tetratricopeptide (TPR) repeat protein
MKKILFIVSLLIMVVSMIAQPTRPSISNPDELADAARKKRNYVEAIRLYDEAIKQEPKFFKHQLSKGICEIKLKKYEEARTSLHKAIELKKDCSPAYMQLANICKIKKDYKGAAAEYIKAIAIQDPKQQLPTKMMLADVLIKDSDLAGAEKVVTEVQISNPENMKVIFYAGEIKYAKKDYNGAIMEYQKCTQLEKFKAMHPEQQAQYYYAIGKSYLDLNDELNAQVNWRKAYYGQYQSLISDKQPIWGVEFAESQLQSRQDAEARGEKVEPVRNVRPAPSLQTEEDSDSGWGF